MENNVKHPSLKEYNQIENYTNAIQDVQRSLASLQSHFEILKRSGDVRAIIDFDDDLQSFLVTVIAKYKATLKDEKED